MRLFTFISTLFFLFYKFPSSLQVGGETSIQSPHPNEAIQGIYTIIGTTSIDGFLEYNLSFSFEDDPTGTWFVIHTGTEPVENDTIGTWDTTTLTDGSYNLRLIVHLLDDNTTTINIDNIRVRNYSPIETDTPAPTNTPNPEEPPPPTHTPIPPTPTPLPPNPAGLFHTDIENYLVGGVFGALACMLILGLYNRIKK
jgi:hypothetical protein